MAQDQGPIPETTIDIVNELIPKSTAMGAYNMGIVTAIYAGKGLLCPRELLEEVSRMERPQDACDAIKRYMADLTKPLRRFAK